MENDDKYDEAEGLTLPRSLTSGLRGRQSVRATFKLTEGCIEAISIVATHLGIKQKSLFDHLIEDMQSLSSIAGEIQNSKLRIQNRVQKTYVMSRKSLLSLEQVSKNYNAPRDILVEFSVQRLLPIIARERERHEKRKEILAGITKHFNQGVKILHNISYLLGDDDPIFDRFATTMAVYQKSYEQIESYIEKGKIIEEFELEGMEE
jgi:predicted DNA-binding protein YlxM (UPF0122 family)